MSKLQKRDIDILGRLRLMRINQVDDFHETAKRSPTILAQSPLIWKDPLA
jgi:hypothetical protein